MSKSKITNKKSVIKAIVSFFKSAGYKDRNKGVSLDDVQSLIDQKRFDEAELMLLRFVTGKTPEKVTKETTDAVMKLGDRVAHLKGYTASPEVQREKIESCIMRTRSEAAF